MASIVDSYYDVARQAFDMQGYLRVNFQGQFGRMVAIVQMYRGQLEYYQQLQPGTSKHVLALYGCHFSIKIAPASTLRIMPTAAFLEAMSLISSTSSMLSYMTKAPIRGPKTQVQRALGPYIAKFEAMKTSHAVTLSQLDSYPQNDPAPILTSPAAIERLGSIWSIDADAILAYLTKVGTYAALFVSSALRQHSYRINPQETENTEMLVQAAIAEAAALSLVIDEGVFKSAAGYMEAVVPAELFRSFTTPHLVGTAFFPYIGACDIANAITAVRGGTPAEILALAFGPSDDLMVGELYTDSGKTIRIGSKAPILSIFLYGAFLAKTGTSAATDLNLQPANLIAGVPNLTRETAEDIQEVLDQAMQRAETNGGGSSALASGGNGLMISDPHDAIGYLLAPINDALTIALTGLEVYVSSGMDFLTDFKIPTLNLRLPPPPRNPTIPNIGPYVHQLTAALAEGVTEAGDAVLRQCNSILADYRKFLNSGLVQEVSIELSKAVTSGLEVYFGILNEAVAIWSKTIWTILKSFVIRIEPKIKAPVIAPATPPSLTPIIVRAQRPVATAATRATVQVGAVVSDISEGIHVIGFVMLMVVFLSILFKVL